MHTSRSILPRRWLGAGAAAVVLAAASPRPATAAGGDDPPEQATGWYLALGDSLATGYQPDRGEDRAGGYVGPVLAGIRAEQPKTKLINLSCYGESTVTMRDGTHCSGAYEEGSQLADAVEFLHAHRRATHLVTVTLGSNDVTPCLSAADIRTCAERQLLVVDHNMRSILGVLHDTAPDVPIVVTNYYNPYLALFFDPSRRALVPLTSALQAQLNTTLVNATAAATGGEGGSRTWPPPSIPTTAAPPPAVCPGTSPRSAPTRGCAAGVPRTFTRPTRATTPWQPPSSIASKDSRS